MNKDLIKKLQDNKAHRIFIDMSEEEHQVLWKLKEKGFVQVLTNMMKWTVYSSGLLNIDIYRINPNYQQEPEFVDLEITVNGQWLGIVSNDIKVLPFVFTKLYELPSLPNFVEFRYENGITLYFIHVASKVAQGNKVFARLRT